MEDSNRRSSEPSGAQDTIRIAVETGEDEAFLVGTRAAFLKLARALMDAANAPERHSEVDGIRVQWSTKTHRLVSSELAFTAECVCETEEDAQLVYQHFVSISPKST
jgi:hypothetical protein